MSVPCIYGCHTYHTERMQQNRTCHKSQLASLNVWDWETFGEVLFRVQEHHNVQEANAVVARWHFLELDKNAVLLAVMASRPFSLFESTSEKVN